MTGERGDSEEAAGWNVLSLEEETVLGVVSEAVETIQVRGSEPSFDALCRLLGEAGVTGEATEGHAGLFRFGSAVFRLRLNPEDSAAVDIVFEEGSA